LDSEFIPDQRLKTTKPASRLAMLRVQSARLLNGRREIIIEHGAEEYRLRLTGGGKLLLTK
jgi:hemin uptake protein HemP